MTTPQTDAQAKELEDKLRMRARRREHFAIASEIDKDDWNDEGTILVSATRNGRQWSSICITPHERKLWLAELLKYEPRKVLIDQSAIDAAREALMGCLESAEHSKSCGVYDNAYCPRCAVDKALALLEGKK